MHESTLPPRRRYAPEMKLEIVQEAIAGKRSKAAIARKHGINANQVSNWIREYNNNARWVDKAKIPMLPVVVEQERALEISAEILSEREITLPVPPQPKRSSVDVQFGSGHTLTISNPTDEQLGLILRTLA